MHVNWLVPRTIIFQLRAQIPSHTAAIQLPDMVRQVSIAGRESSHDSTAWLGL